MPERSGLKRYPMVGLITFLIFLGSTVGNVYGANSTQPGEPASPSTVEGMDTDHQEHADGAIESMIPHQQHTGPHMRWTALRPPIPDDAERADQIVQTLRQALAKYKNPQVAVADGYQPRHPERKQRHYHFPNKQRRFMATVRFEPAEPTALLYKKTETGYELEGAMYTAPRHFTETQLNERIPLSVAQWHAHVNICLPPEGNPRRMNRRQFGFKGAIVTESDCEHAGGRFFPQIGGWMLHVYPFEATPGKIWTH